MRFLFETWSGVQFFNYKTFRCLDFSIIKILISLRNLIRCSIAKFIYSLISRLLFKKRKKDVKTMSHTRLWVIQIAFFENKWDTGKENWRRIRWILENKGYHEIVLTILGVFIIGEWSHRYILKLKNRAIWMFYNWKIEHLIRFRREISCFIIEKSSHLNVL